MNYRRRIESVMKLKIPAADGRPWKYITSRKEGGIYEYVYRVPAGYSHLDITRQIDALYAVCGAIVEIKEYAGAVVIRIIPEDFPAVVPYEGNFLQQSAEQIMIGLDRQNMPLVHSLRVPHLLIAGKSGYGKTDLIRWILYQLIASGVDVDIWIIDLKGFSFLPFKNIQQISRIARDLPGAVQLLSDAVKIMEERSAAVWNSGDRTKTKDFKKLYVLIDEAYQISPKVTTNKERKKLASICDEAAAKISGTGREAGIGLFYCTQRPDADVINPLVKANMDCKICFKTETESNSLIVLDAPGAERLPHGKPGRVLYSRDGLTEAQVPYIGNDEAWTALLEPYKEEKQNETERGNTNPCEGDTAIFDGPSGEILLTEWEPFQEGKRTIDEIRTRTLDRRTEEGNRKNQAVAPLVDWSEAFRDK